MKLPGKGLSWKELAKRLEEEYRRDNVRDSAAALAYFGMLAIFPFILFLVALAGLFMDPQRIRELVAEAEGVIPPEAAGLLESRLQSLAEGSSGGLLTVGVLGAIWAASKGVMALSRALNTTYDVEEGRPAWKVRLVAIGLTLFTAVFALTATLAAVATPAIADAIGGPAAQVITWLRIPVAALLMMVLFAVLYWALPDVKQKFRFISPGAVTAVILWALASWGFSVYVRNFGNFDATYGALGAVIVLLLWMWISAQALLLGAEINAILEHASPRGKRKGAKEEIGAAPLPREQVERRRQPPPAGRPEERPPTLH